MGIKNSNAEYNWNYLKRYHNIEFFKTDVRNFDQLTKLCDDVDQIIHAAAQTAVTTSLSDPKVDFEVNVIGTFNILEAARRFCANPAVVFCSTNKVYGANVNNIPTSERRIRYAFEGEFENGIPESFPTDLCEHTPYGSSKWTADIYMQEYGKTYGLKTGIFRMSCIYGPRQFGVEDQGWVSWLTIATITGKPITLYGNGKQVRDVLYISDLIKAFDAFIQKKNSFSGEVFNIGGGPDNALSLLELLDILEQLTGKQSKTNFSEWRPSDQKVYISNISKAKERLGWSPKVSPKEGVEKLVHWVLENRHLFE